MTARCTPGWTTDLDRRLARHQAGTASRYTASRLPVALELALPMDSRTAARREEARIKRLSRRAKLALVHERRRSTRYAIFCSSLTPATIFL